MNGEGAHHHHSGTCPADAVPDDRFQQNHKIGSAENMLVENVEIPAIRRLQVPHKIKYQYRAGNKIIEVLDRSEYGKSMLTGHVCY